MKFVLLSTLVLGFCDTITVRRDIYEMTEQEKVTFKQTILAATTLPDSDFPAMSIWAAAAKLHVDNAQQIHNSGIFFPFHRLFIRNIERKLQAINPDFSFPYWNSNLEHRNVDWKASIALGLGFTENQPYERELSNTNMPSLEQWSNLYETSSTNRRGFDYYATQAELLHAVLHNCISGTMSTMSSPLDPLFYMHHAHIDFEWSKAQAGWAANNYPQVGGLINGQPGTFTSKIPAYDNVFGDVLDMGNLCVRYAPRGEPRDSAALISTTTSTNITVPTSVSITTTSTISATPVTTTPVTTTTISSTSTTTAAASKADLINQIGGSLLSAFSALPATEADKLLITTATTLTSTSTSPTPFVTISSNSTATTIPTLTVTISSATPTIPTLTITSSSAIPTVSLLPASHQVLAAYVPADYKKLVECPAPLTADWIKMNNFNATTAQSQDKVCQNLITRVAAGETFLPVPHYSVANYSTAIQASLPDNFNVSAPQAKPISVPQTKPSYNVVSGAFEMHSVTASILLAAVILF